MRIVTPLFALAAVLAAAACKKEAPATRVEGEAVPISRDPRHAAAQLSAAQRAAALAGQNDAKRDDAAKAVLDGK